MRFIVYGAGAVGGVVGGRLAESGNEVALIARGAHAEALRRSGLVLETPESRQTVRIPVVEHPGELTFGDDDVVLLAVKSQDTVGALDALAHVAPITTPIFCLQNGVENERAAERLFERVYGVWVMSPTGHLAPGVVQAFSAPVLGLLDVGRYPSGCDVVAEMVVDALGEATFGSLLRPDIMRWKYSKLLRNLGNALGAICGTDARSGPLGRLLYDEGAACLRAAGIEFVTKDEESDRCAALPEQRDIGGQPRTGGSTWQSLERRTGSIETDYLNGEIVLLGRQYEVPTPANALLQRLCRELAAARAAPGSIEAAELLEMLDSSASTI